MKKGLSQRFYFLSNSTKLHKTIKRGRGVVAKDMFARKADRADINSKNGVLNQSK